MTTTVFDDEAGAWRRDVSVVVGTPQVIFIPSVGIKLGLLGVPGASGTAKVETTLSNAASITADTALWVTWTAGASAAAAQQLVDMPVTAVRLTATVATATFSLVQ
jgi:hypothetical protein